MHSLTHEKHHQGQIYGCTCAFAVCKCEEAFCREFDVIENTLNLFETHTCAESTESKPFSAVFFGVLGRNPAVPH